MRSGILTYGMGTGRVRVLMDGAGAVMALLGGYWFCTDFRNLLKRK
jgi:hypothetical protein